MAEKQFTILLKRSSDYKIMPGQTVYGGPLPDLSGILMNICVDHSAFPNYIAHEIQADGRVDTNNIVDQVQIANLERELLCGIVFTVDQARSVVKWLERHIKQIEDGTNE